MRTIREHIQISECLLTTHCGPSISDAVGIYFPNTRSVRPKLAGASLHVPFLRASGRVGVENANKYLSYVQRGDRHIPDDGVFSRGLRTVRYQTLTIVIKLRLLSVRGCHYGFANWRLSCSRTRLCRDEILRCNINA